MKTFSALGSGLWVVAALGFGKAIMGCGSDFTCVEDLSCPSRSAPAPEGGGAGGSGATAGSTGSGGSGAAQAADASGADGDSAPVDAGDSGGEDSGGSDANATDSAVDASTCETEQPIQQRGVFVSKSGSDGSDGSACGSIGTPCATIKKALSLAKAGSIVYLDAGTYDEDGLALGAEIALQGGWARRTDGTWRHVCGAESAEGTVIRAKTADRTLSAVDLGGVATLEMLTVRSKSAPAAAVASVYGIFATGATTEVVLRNVAVEVGAAGAGAAGLNGRDGAQVATACPAGTGQEGTALGTGGAGAPSATFNVTGFLPAAGVEGGPGSSGTNGTGAPSPPCASCPHELAACRGSCPTNPCQQVVCEWTTLVTTCWGIGSSGCGGDGGKGGGPGGGGGSSIGIFLWNARLRIDSGRVRAGAGGTGGPGGKGGNGGLGTPGLSGSAVSCGGCGRVSELSCAIQPSALAGLPGGTGGSGKAGGPGGGGSGGHSYAVYRGGAATASVAADVELTAGAPGSGGGVAPGRGADGSAKPVGP